MTTPKEFADDMKQAQDMFIQGIFQQDDVHRKMDYIICELLSELGYNEGIEIFNQTPKWYA